MGVVGVVGVVVAAAVAVVVIVGVEVLVIVVVVAAVAAVGGYCVYPTLSHYSLLPLPLLQSAWRLRLLVCHCSHCSTEQNGTTYQQILLYLAQPNT